MKFDTELKTFAVCAVAGVLFITVVCAVASLIPTDETEVWGSEGSMDVKWKFEYTDHTVDHVVCAMFPKEDQYVYLCTMNAYGEKDWKVVERSDILTVYELDKLNDWIVKPIE